MAAKPQHTYTPRLLARVEHRPRSHDRSEHPAPRALAAVRRAGLRTGPGILITLLLPKCPLCLAALLTSLGLGGALAQRLAPWLHAAWFGVGCAAIAAPLSIWLLYWLRARSSAAACSCGSKSQRFTPARSSSRRT